MGTAAFPKDGTGGNWEGSGNPTTDQTTQVGTILKYNFYTNTDDYTLWWCLDPTPNSMVWRLFSPIQPDWNQSDSSAIDFIKNKPSILTASFSSPNFSTVTSATQLSTTRDAVVNYVFPTTMTSLLTAQTLTATLQYADNSGMSTNLVTVNVDVNGCSGILSLTLSGRLQVSGRIPAGKYSRVVLAQTGGATIPTTLSSSQAVLV